MFTYWTVVVLCQVEGGHDSNSGSIASRESEENGTGSGGKDLDKQNILESSLERDVINFARAAVSPTYLDQELNTEH